MNNKLLFAVVTIIILTCIFALSTTLANAKNLDIFSSKKQIMIVTLKNDVNIDVSKDKISQVPQIKIVKIKDRNKEWSNMVNKMDLPKMENPFKNEFIIKTNKRADINEIYNKIKQMDFVEDVEYSSDTKYSKNTNK